MNPPDDLLSTDNPSSLITFQFASSFLYNYIMCNKKEVTTKQPNPHLQFYRNINFLMCCSIKDPYLSHRRVFGLTTLTPHPPPTALENYSIFLYLLLKNLAFDTSHTLRICNDLPWGGYGHFMELHNSFDNDFNCQLKFYLLF